VGYGDIYPETHAGRGVTVIACIWGVFVVSLFVVIINNYIQLSTEEQQAYDQFLQRLDIRDTLSTDAALIVQLLFRMKKAKKRGASATTLRYYENDLIAVILRFRKYRRIVTANTPSVSDIINDTHDSFDNGALHIAQNIAPTMTIVEKMDLVKRDNKEICEKMISVHISAKRLSNIVSGYVDGKFKEFETKDKNSSRPSITEIDQVLYPSMPGSRTNL